MKGSDSCISSVVVDKHVHNQSRRLKPKPHKHPEPDEYLEYLNINNYSNSRDYDGKTQTTYTEHREYIKIIHAKDQVKGTMQTAVEKTNASKQVDVPAGSKIFGGFIIPPFFSLSRNKTKADNDLPLSSGNFLSKMLNRLITSPTKVNEGEVDEVIGQRLSIWEERKKAGAFLDSYLRDCVSKESSVYSPEEKVEMKRIQDILIREKEEERERDREAKEKKDEEQRRMERQKKKKAMARKERKEKESLRRKKKQDDDDGELETTLGTVLSAEHPLFARKFREKVRIFTRSGTEVNVDKNGISVVDDRSSNDSQLDVTDGTIDLVQAIREENKKTRQILKRVYSSEADWCSPTIEPNNPNSHQIDLTGDVEVEFSHKVMEENHKLLHKLQIDQAKEIQLNKIIIEENKRTLKKLKIEQEKEKLRRSVNNDDFKIKKTPSGRFLKERKKLLRKKSKCSIIESSARLNTNLEKDSRENKPITSESEKIVNMQPKKKAWSTEMLSKKEKAQQKRKNERRNETNLDSLRDYNNIHSSKDAEAAARRKPNQLKEFSLEKENNVQVIPNVEEERNFDDVKVIPRNKRVKKLEIRKSPQGDICIPGRNVVRNKWEGPNKSEIDEDRCEIHHGQLSRMQDTQTVEDFLMEENQRSTFQYCNSSRDNTEYGPSTIESMIQEMKEAGLTKNFVPMKRKPLDDCLFYDQHGYSSEENVSTPDIRTHATNDRVFYQFQKRNGCYEHIYCKDDEISQHIKSAGEEGEISSCENRNIMSETRKRRVTKRRKRIGHSAENTTSKESMSKSIQVRDEAIKERRKYISNRRKKAQECGDGHPVESTNRMDARKIAQDACLQTYQEVQSKLRLLGNVLKEGDIVKISKQVKPCDHSLKTKFQGTLKDKFCKQRFPKDQILKFNSEKDSVCVPSITRSKRAGLVVSKRKMGFNCRSSHKGYHVRNHERKHKIQDKCCNQSHQEKSLCMTPDAVDNLLKSENCRRSKLKETKVNEDERKLVESTNMERKSKLTELLNKVNRKTATYSLLCHLIEQDQYYSDSSEDDFVPDIRQGKEREANDSKYRLMVIERPKESTSDERVIAAKRRRTSSKLNDRRSRHIMDLETKVLYKRKSPNQINTESHQRLASLDAVESHTDLPHLDSEAKVYYVRGSSNEKKTKKKNRSFPEKEISDKDLTILEPEPKVVDKRESSHQNQRKNQKKNRSSPDEGISDKDHSNLKPVTKFVHKSENSHPRKTKSHKLVTPVEAVDSHKDLPYLEPESKVHHKIEKSNHRMSKSQRVALLDEEECDKDHLKSNTSHHEVNVAQEESKKQRGMKGNRVRGGHDSDASRHRDGRRSKRRDRSKRDREQIRNVSSDIIFERDAKENNFGADTNAVQEDAILLQKTSYEPSDQISSIPNVRSQKMVEHMSNVLSEYLATNRQNRQTEEVDGGKRKKEQKGDEELREAVEKVRRPTQSDQENEGWKKANETLETGQVTKGRKNRDVVLLSTSCSRNHIIRKHIEECVEEFDHYLSATDKHKEHFERHVNNADLKHKISEINTKCDQGDGIFFPVFARHPAQMSSDKSGNICPSGSAENDKNVASRSHKRVKVLEQKSDASKSCKGNNNNIQSGGPSKKRDRDPNKGYVTKKASSSLKDKMSGHISLNNEDFDNAAGDVLKKGERSEKGQKSLDEEDHFPPRNYTGLFEKCAICMTPDSSVKSQCSAMVHQEVVAHRCECISTSQLNEKPKRPESNGNVHFESEVHLHGNGETKCEGKPICEISSDDNIIDCRKDATSCDCETLNVISCLDTPDKAINEIFKKMDDVIINRFLTLASNNGITIVVTPKVVCTSDSNDDMERKPEEFSKEGFEVNAHNTNKVMAKSNEESMKGTEVSDTNNNVANNIGTVNDKTAKSYRNEHECIIGHQSKDCDPVELKSAVNGKSFVNKIESIISNQESQVKFAWKHPSKKKVVSRQYKNNLYFITQTFCKNSKAIRRNKKFRMRLPCNKTMQTGSKVRRMADWYQSEQERIEQQVIEGQQVVVDATSPDYNGPEDMRKGKICYDHCYEQVLHCLPSPQQVKVNADRESKKQKDFPVDQLLEKIRSNLDEDEMELLDAASRSTINVLSERRKFETCDEGLNLLFCKDDYTNLSSTSSMVPNIKTIKEVIAEADSNDNLLSICECFGVDTIDDLMDHLKSISSNDGVEQIESRHGKNKCNKKQKRNYWHKENMKNDKEIGATGSLRKRINRNGVGMIDDHSKIHSKDIYDDTWYCTTKGKHPKPKESFEFRDVWHCEHSKINAINKWIKNGELETRESAREKKTGINQFPNKKKMQKDECYELYSKDINGDACFSLSSFIHNYALKSGIIFADSSTTLAKDNNSEDPDTDDVLNVKIQLNEDGSKKKTSILIEVPETQDFVLAKKMYKGTPSLMQAPPSPLHSSAQIVHVDSEEIVLSTDLPEEPEWSAEQEEAFQKALKKHPPTLNVWDRIAKSVGRSKKDCVLHFMAIWRRLDTTSV